MRQVEPNVLLRFADDGLRIEAMLADGTSDRAGEEPGLKRRDAYSAVVFGAPRLLVGRDEQVEAAVAELVPRGGALTAAPVRQVVRKPAAEVQLRPLERVLELELVRNGARLRG
jgi:hypothetical protein